MIVIDTHVVSEIMRDQPDHHVDAWARRADQLHTTAVTVAEVDYGIARLPRGRRRNELSAEASQLFDYFDDVIVAFDHRAARRYGMVVADRERSGRPIATADAQIAAICLSRSAMLATRNTDNFAGTGVDLVNPWLT